MPPHRHIHPCSVMLRTYAVVARSIAHRQRLISLLLQAPAFLPGISAAFRIQPYLCKQCDDAFSQRAWSSAGGHHSPRGSHCSISCCACRVYAAGGERSPPAFTALMKVEGGPHFIVEYLWQMDTGKYEYHVVEVDNQARLPRLCHWLTSLGCCAGEDGMV